MRSGAFRVMGRGPARGRMIGWASLPSLKNMACFLLNANNWPAFSAKPSGDVIVGFLEKRIGKQGPGMAVFDHVSQEHEGGVVAGAGGLLHVVGHDEDPVGPFQLLADVFDLA